MRVIITGGTGLIGSGLAASFARDGHEVILLTRNPANKTAAPGMKLVQWDAKTADGWGHLADGAGAIINLAGESIGGDQILPLPWTQARRDKIALSRLHVGEAVTAAVAAASAKPGLVFQMSGTDYYPYTDQMVTEETPPGTHFLATVIKDYWEKSTEHVEEMGVKRVIARMGPLLNKENGPLPPMILQYKLYVGGRLGDGTQYVPWIHMDDAILAIRFLIDQQAEGVYNTVAPNPVTYQELADTLGQVMGRPSLIPVPGFALRTALGEVADLVLKGRPVSSAKLTGLGYTFKFPTVEPALRNLLDA
jgi:uncharacterized protein